MATLLLVVIYIAYIGLGVPDSLFGTAWPAMYEEFDLPISTANIVTLLTTTGTIISSLLSARLINRFGTGIVTAVSTSLTAIALLGYSQSDNIYFLCLFCFPLGFGAGAIDAAQNGYVAVHYNARHMNFLHCFYGVGVAVSPFLMSLGLKLVGWRMGYLLAFGLQAVISIVTIIALPLWGKAHPENKQTKEEKFKTISLVQQAKMPAVRMAWLMFIASCGIESICTTWGSTFLVEKKGMAVDVAALMLVLYFAGLALGRFTAGVFAKKLSSWRLMQIGCCLIITAVVLLALPIHSVALACIGLFLTGFGIGPIYPNLMHLVPINFGEENAQAIIGSQMTATYLSILLTPITFGILAQEFGLVLFPYAIGVMFALFAYAFLRSICIFKKEGKYRPNELQ